MKPAENKPKLKFTFKKTLLWTVAGIMFVLSGAGFYFYKNFNRLLSEALLKSFNANIASDVYELKFKDLNINLVLGNIKVNNVLLQPREKPLKDYPYINSKIKLTTKQLLLSNVEIITLLKENRLQLERIKIEEPDVELIIDNKIPIFLPFNDSTVVNDTVQRATKRPITAFSLEKFDLINATLHLENFAKERDLTVKNLNISLRDLLIDQKHGKDLMKFSTFNFSIDEITGFLKKESVKYISLKDCGIVMDSLEIHKSVDTFIYHFTDFNMGFRDLDVQTYDSIFHLTLKTFSISYADSLVNIENLAFSPNISQSEMQKRTKFQQDTWFSGKIGQLKITGVNFDSLFYKKKLFIETIAVDSVSMELFKDKTKPVDVKKLPEYLGQTVAGIPMPLIIGQINATNVNLVSREIKPDSTRAEANINRGTASATNITNISAGGQLSIQAEAFLENKVPFKVNLGFDYLQPSFNYSGSFANFKLTDLNSLINAYTPVTANNGIIDQLEFSGEALETEANGTMKFFYHDLNIEVKLEEKAKWKNSVLSFAANTVVATSNPVSENQPPKIVNYHVDRDMNKAFVNVVIKSALLGMKETIIMSKENRKEYKEAKKKAKKEGKK